MEIRRLHRRFGHPATNRLYKLLKSAGYTGITQEALEKINTFCEQCQLNSNPPKRFKFSLKDDYDFNYEILADIMYLESRPVLHVLDVATSFQGAAFLQGETAKEV